MMSKFVNFYLKSLFGILKVLVHFLANFNWSVSASPGIYIQAILCMALS